MSLLYRRYACSRRLTRFHHLVIGLRKGYPLCCVLSWAFDPYPHSCQRRGLIDLGRRPTGETHRWVPCRWHVHRHAAWRPRKTQEQL